MPAARAGNGAALPSSHRPVYVAVAERDGQRRVIAVDGCRRRLWSAMGHVLTGHVTHINDVLTKHQASRT